MGACMEIRVHMIAHVYWPVPGNEHQPLLCRYGSGSNSGAASMEGNRTEPVSRTAPGSRLPNRLEGFLSLQPRRGVGVAF